MSERTYFSLRYVVPGFTFTLVILFFIVDYINTDLPFAIITGIGSPAFGFIITQCWWLIFQKIMPYYMNNIENEIYQTFNGITTDSFNLLTVWNFIINTVNKRDKDLAQYLTRRYDIFNLLWSLVFLSISFIIISAFF